MYRIVLCVYVLSSSCLSFVVAVILGVGLHGVLISLGKFTIMSILSNHCVLLVPNSYGSIGKYGFSNANKIDNFSYLPQAEEMDHREASGTISANLILRALEKKL